MPRSRIGIVAAGLIALAAGTAAFAPTGGADDSPGRSVTRRADAICAHAAGEASRLPRRPVARAAGIARILRSTASGLRSLGTDDLAWAHQTWAAAVDDVRQALRTRGGSARAGATVLVAREDAAVAAGVLPAPRCVQLARGDQM